MSTGSFSILPVEEADLSTLAQFVQESKLPLTINRLLIKNWPNHEFQKENANNAVGRNVKNPSTARFKAVDEESGLMVGHIVLTLKKPYEADDAHPATLPGNDQPSVPNGMVEEVFRTVVATASELDTEKDVDHLGELFSP
jgi:hypothetical protein